MEYIEDHTSLGTVNHSQGLFRDDFMAYSGRYKVQNAYKYRGNVNNVIYRSSWELKLLRWLDRHPDVLWFSSEEVVVPYISPLDNKIHRYFPDFLVCIRLKDDVEKTILIEVKPEGQMIPPDPKRRNNTPSGRVSRRFLNEAKTYAVNQAKWDAARQYCRSKGWEFAIWGETALGIK